MFIKPLFLVAIYLAVLQVLEACKGCINIDEHNINKILPRFKAVLVKFDVSYPYGEKHEAFETVADDTKNAKDLILAQIGIKDYGEKDNEELAKKFGIKSKEDLPHLKLFLQGETSPKSYDKNQEWTPDSIRKFIRQHTDVYIGLSGCLEEFDKLAAKFLEASDKDAKVKEAETVAKKLTKEEEKHSAETYIKFMNKVVENGISFIKQEISRLGKLIKDGKINDRKKKELSDRLNILQAFSTPEKDEL